MKKISVLGSTGSIGKNSLLVARHLGPEKIRVVALAARNNIDLLEKQAREFHPEIVAVHDCDKAIELQKKIPHIPVFGGSEGLVAVATHAPANFVIAAISGNIGLSPTVAAIKARKNIGFATKEVLVSAGEMIMSLVRENKIDFIPIDSELTAIFQCLKGSSVDEVQRLIITASGGPFRNFTSEQLENVTLSHALNHPNYKMGSKVTIDSSTLMNKGLEMIEAHWLFGTPLKNIEVVVHPQQIIHSMVEFVDGSILAQMCEPDMLIPIQYAITHPQKFKGSLPPFDFFKNGTLTFLSPDLEQFRCLKLAYQAIENGKSFPCYMNAANEIFVESFLNKHIRWTQIAEHLETLMMRHQPMPIDSLEDLFAIDALARHEAKKLCN